MLRLQESRLCALLGALAILLLASCGSPQSVASHSVEAAPVENPDMLGIQATALLEQGNPEGSIALLDRAIALKPGDAKLYYNRGNAYAAKADHQRAVQDYDSATKIDPNLSTAHFNCGNSFKLMGSIDSAVSRYSMAIQVNPRYTAAYINRASLYMQKGELKPAMADLTEVISFEKGPKVALAYANRAAVYEMMGRKDLAARDLSQLNALGGPIR